MSSNGPPLGRIQGNDERRKTRKKAFATTTKQRIYNKLFGQQMQYNRHNQNEDQNKFMPTSQSQFAFAKKKTTTTTNKLITAFCIPFPGFIYILKKTNLLQIVLKLSNDFPVL